MSDRYRVGRKLGRTIYRDDKLIGVMDSEDDARRIVDLLNGDATKPGTSGWSSLFRRNSR